MSPDQKCAAVIAALAMVGYIFNYVTYCIAADDEDKGLLWLRTAVSISWMLTMILIVGWALLLEM